MSACLLVVAKAPVPGFAKTRLSPPATPAEAADIAAAALLDTLDAVTATAGTHPVVAITGDIAAAARGSALRAALRNVTVVHQRGGDFANRLANAHADVAALRPGVPVLQIGMDTPQITPELLGAAVHRLRTEDVLGLAADGGWWALGLRDPHRATALRTVPMSAPDTGELTRRALAVTSLLPVLSDVDTVADARAVAATAPRGRFAAAVHRAVPR